MNKDLYLFLFLNIFVIIIYIFDITSTTTSKCINNSSNKYKIISILLLHHYLQLFSNFGWLFNNKYILIYYIFIPFITILHWYTNNNKCILTQIINKLCNNNEDVYFNDIFNMIGLKKYNIWNDYLHYIYLLFVIFYTIYKLI